jgi:hypothetical protein
MKFIVSAWFVYGIFNLDSLIHEELYLTNNCESTYEEIIKEEDLQIKSSDYTRNYVGYVCYDSGNS